MNSYIFIPNDVFSPCLGVDAEDIYDAKLLLQEQGANLDNGEVVQQDNIGQEAL